MTQSTALIDTLKQALKLNRLTYNDVAGRLGMSTANVKRMFASRRITLERLEEICQLMDMDLTDLVQMYDESRQRISQLSEEQERDLVKNEKLLLVAVAVRNHLTFDEILAKYLIKESECIKALAALDRLKIIDLLPGNRIKLRIDENFRWLPNGPIEHFFERQIQGHFLKAGFKGEDEQRLFLFGVLGEASAEVLNKKIQALAKEFADLHRQDAKLPLAKRKNFGFMLALRPWELQAFEPYRRHPA